MKVNYGTKYSLPMLIWLTLLFIVPSAIIIMFSFMEKNQYGGVNPVFSLQAFKDLMNSAYFKILLNTIYIAVMSTIFTLLLALPSAYYMARSKYKSFLMLLIIIPFWTNFLIRVYAWIAVLGNNGFINQFLLKIGLIKDYIGMLYNNNAVILVMVYTYLPYAILPLYAIIEKFDFSLLEAARDLGASKSQSVFRILIPNIKSGIITSLLFTFIPAFGNYAIPQIIGDKNTNMLGTVIARELTTGRNWPLASAISMLLTLVTVIGVLVFTSKQKNIKKVI
ncbi:MAG TPA: ABC transporter permease [Tepiditoga sp.]|nr:ABC transporter permease [Tepiditoga sp.]